MTWFEIYAFFGSPLLLVALGVAAYWMVRRDTADVPGERKPD